MGTGPRYHCQLILDPATRSLHERKGVGYWRASHLGYEYSGEERRSAPVPEAILRAPLFEEWVWFRFDLLPVRSSRRSRLPSSRST